MPFNTYTFVIFFLFILALYTLLNNWKFKKINLLVASYLFYSAWNPVFVFLLFFSTFCDWHLAKYIYKANSKKSKNNFLIISILINLGLLGYFKYGDFVLTNILSFVETWGIRFHPLEMDIILPVGISFYTFQTLSYAIDVYRGKIKPGTSFLDYALYVSFFPQLVAGPIVRAGTFLPQCESSRKASSDQIGWGLSLILFGLFMKVILADVVFAPVVDNFYNQPETYNILESWTAIFAFSGQIYCDFAGYSTCAIGIALCFGFILPDNFRAPYAALGFSEFWQRWHISLSSWFRDYLYISLGGNRVSSIRTTINIMLTMLVAGLWHGASWMFVIWGGLHGLYLVIERIVKKYIHVNNRRFIFEFVLILFTYVVVSITWVFFRSIDLGQAGLILSKLVTPTSLFIWNEDSYKIALFVSVLVFVWQLYIRNHSIEQFFSKISVTSRCLILFSQLLIIFLFAAGDDRAFIYFQF
jgi:alginate O-acetyltransferase complex protein AlgI